LVFYGKRVDRKGVVPPIRRRRKTEEEISSHAVKSVEEGEQNLDELGVTDAEGVFFWDGQVDAKK